MYFYFIFLSIKAHPSYHHFHKTKIRLKFMHRRGQEDNGLKQRGGQEDIRLKQIGAKGEIGLKRRGAQEENNFAEIAQTTEDKSLPTN